MSKIKYEFEGILSNMNILLDKKNLLDNISELINSLNIDDSELNSILSSAKKNTVNIIEKASDCLHNRINKTNSLCEDYMSYESYFKLENKLSSQYISLPKEYGNSGFFSYTVIDDIIWDDSKDPYKVYKKWIDEGKESKNAIATIGDRYLVATTDTFGSIGDKVNFYLEDGTVLECVLKDAKAQVYCDHDHNPANKWGHKDGQQVIEFEVTDVLNDTGDVGTWIGISGQRVVSALNLGENILED